MKPKGEIHNYFIEKYVSDKIQYECLYCGTSYKQRNATRMKEHILKCSQCPINIKKKFGYSNLPQPEPTRMINKNNSEKKLRAFKLFKRSKSRKSARNRISPLVRSPSYSGTVVDARSEIDIQRYCPCRASLPTPNESFDGYSSCNSYDSSRNESLKSYECGYNCARSDSAYESARSSPARAPVCYATVTYFNVNDSEDSSSIRTEYTLLDYDVEDKEMNGTEERAQNFINESLELVSTL